LTGQKIKKKEKKLVKSLSSVVKKLCTLVKNPGQFIQAFACLHRGKHPGEKPRELGCFFPLRREAPKGGGKAATPGEYEARICRRSASAH